MGRKLKVWAENQRRRVRLMELLLRHPQTPWYAKAVGGATVLYAVSPIDLIPDFIPVIGHLDDLLLVPIGLWLTYALITESVRQECRARMALVTTRFD